MVFDKDWFSMWSAPQFISGSRGCTPCCPGFPTFKAFPGCNPDGTYYWAPYTQSNSRGGVHRFQFPDACTIKQFVGCNWTFGASDSSEGTDYRLRFRKREFDGTVDSGMVGYANELYTATERQADRGSVWDIARFFLKGTECEILFRQWRGANQNNNAFVVALTGEWFRADDPE